MNLPQCVIKDLRAAGCIVRDKCKIVIIEAVTNGQCKVFERFLLAEDAEDAEDSDPILTPHFGNPMAQYCSPYAQVEVHQLLNAYQGLMKGDFAPG